MEEKDNLPDISKPNRAESALPQYQQEALVLQSGGTAIIFILDSHRVLKTVAQEMAQLLANQASGTVESLVPFSAKRRSVLENTSISLIYLENYLADAKSVIKMIFET